MKKPKIKSNLEILKSIRKPVPKPTEVLLDKKEKLKRKKWKWKNDFD
jgi:hypothetical protein